MSASQEFRDGAATGAATIAVRVRQLIGWGVTVDDRMIDKLAEGVVREYGGRVYMAGTTAPDVDVRSH